MVGELQVFLHLCGSPSTASRHFCFSCVVGLVFFSSTKSLSIGEVNVL